MSDRIALITGGSRGLGRNAALHLARHGVDVVITYHSQADEAAKVVAEIESIGRRAVALQLDASATSTFEDFATRLASVLKDTWSRDDFDFLVNNAGFGAYATFEQTTEEQFDAMIDVHFKGVFFLTQRLAPMIVDGGRILNVSSGLTRFSFPGYAAYAAAKGGVEVLTRYLAKELGGRGIAVNTLAPGAIETDFGGGVVRDDADLNRMIASLTALGRVGQPDDVGGAIAALLAGDTGWVTAQRIEVSGGQQI